MAKQLVLFFEAERSFAVPRWRCHVPKGTHRFGVYNFKLMHVHELQQMLNFNDLSNLFRDRKLHKDTFQDTQVSILSILQAFSLERAPYHGERRIQGCDQQKDCQVEARVIRYRFIRQRRQPQQTRMRLRRPGCVSGCGPPGQHAKKRRRRENRLSGPDPGASDATTTSDVHVVVRCPICQEDVVGIPACLQSRYSRFLLPLVSTRYSHIMEAERHPSTPTNCTVPTVHHGTWVGPSSQTRDTNM